MDFSNQNIALAGLPAIEDVEFSNLEADHLKAERISYTIGTSVVVAIGLTAFYFIKSIQTPAIIFTTALCFIILTVIGWIAETISFRNSGYALRQKDLLYRKGWLIRKTRIMPVNRIQHISVQSGPIERRYNLASVSLYTAGSDNADFTIKGLSRETALKIKEWVSQKVTGGTDADEL